MKRAWQRLSPTFIYKPQSCGLPR